MKHISKQAKKTLLKLIAGLDNVGDSKKVDTAKGAFMAVSVEKIGEHLFSVSHYFKQNGDLVPDPDMVFYHSDIDDEFYPVSFQDYFGYKEAVIFKEENITGFFPRLQRELAAFTTTWMRNISYQQTL
jgi:hypothetical protein